MKICLYIATSLDGYIAGVDDDMAWLDAGAESGEDYGYKDFYNSVDALIMGRRTFDWILANHEWPYDKPSWVLTHRPTENAPNSVHFSAAPVDQLYETLAGYGFKSVWLVGGGQIVQSFLQADRIDEFQITVMPILLGNGIPLFPPVSESLQLELVASRAFNSGIVQLFYQI